MDVTIQHPWFKRTLGPFYPSRLFDQFFGEGLFEYDLLPFLSSTISPYYRQSLFRTVLDSGISELMTHMCFVRHQPHTGNPKNNPSRHVWWEPGHGGPGDLHLLAELGRDDHGYISREFHRRYRLPSNVDQSALSCSLSADGMLTFSGPKIQTGLDATHERAIPVAREEKPSSAPSS
uniref:Alpha-crystallin A chain n=1 Tax=Colobus angolensis palliatus TaxID=336983 RepID=A0A2K5IPV9_COLAP